ncbi:hypothetical protein D9M73_249800 [compost metagenome]
MPSGLTKELSVDLLLHFGFLPNRHVRLKQGIGAALDRRLLRRKEQYANTEAECHEDNQPFAVHAQTPSPGTLNTFSVSRKPESLRHN